MRLKEERLDRGDYISMYKKTAEGKESPNKKSEAFTKMSEAQSPGKRKSQLKGARGQKKQSEVTPSEQYLKMATVDKPIQIGRELDSSASQLLKDFSDELLKKVPPELLKYVDKKRLS